MAIKDIVAGGIGFLPGGPLYIVTRGLSIGAAAAITYGEPLEWKAAGRRKHWASFDRGFGWETNRRRQEWGRRI